MLYQKACFLFFQAEMWKAESVELFPEDADGLSTTAILPAL